MIKFKASGRYAACVSDEPITTGSVGIPVVFNLNTDFDALAAIAEFRGSGVTIDVALISDSCVVPPEVVTEAGGTLKIGVYARDGDGKVVIPTVWTDAGIILPGAKPSGVDPSEPTPDWTAQVQAAAREAVDTANRAEKKADQVILDTVAAREATAASEESAGRSAAAAAESAKNAADSEHASAHSADLAEQAAAQSGYMFFEINDSGHLIYHRTDNVSVDFTLENGRLILHGD